MEEKEYFYLNGETKIGPLSLDAIKNAPIQPDTMVWNNSLPDWVEARSLPELQGLFVINNVAEPTPVQSTPPPVSHAPSYNTSGNTFNNPQAPQPMPENYLVWAILTTLLCCLPLGIVSIINATKVSSAYTAGDYAGAQKASEDAKKWAMWSAIGGVIFWVLYIIVVVAFGVFAGLSGF